jgi:hypothetical protein
VFVINEFLYFAFYDLFFGELAGRVLINLLDEPTVEHDVEMNCYEYTRQHHDGKIIQEQFNPV